MNAWTALLVLLTQVCLVGGQILQKHAMNLTMHQPARRPAVFAHLAAGIGLLTIWFLVWTGLLRKLPLSYLYPFEGLSPILMVLAAGVFLKEKMTWRAWAGVALIAAGTLVVGAN